MPTSITDDVLVEHNGKVYRWQDRWVEEETYVCPPQNLGIQIRRTFVENHAPQLLAGCRPQELEVFEALLKSMGATNSDYESLGMKA